MSIPFLTDTEVKNLIDKYSYIEIMKHSSEVNKTIQWELVNFAALIQGEILKKHRFLAPEGCTRSHPHENMNSECKAKTEEIKATVDIKYDLSVAQTESTLRAKLIELGWTPPPDKTNEQLQQRVKELEADIQHFKNESMKYFNWFKEAVKKEK